MLRGRLRAQRLTYILTGLPFDTNYTSVGRLLIVALRVVCSVAACASLCWCCVVRSSTLLTHNVVYQKLQAYVHVSALMPKNNSIPCRENPN